MKAIIFCLFFFCSAASYSQQPSQPSILYFNVNNWDFSDYWYDIRPATSMYFSDDNRFLFITSNYTNSFELTKIDCYKKSVVFTKKFRFVEGVSAKPSPSGKQLVVVRSDNKTFYYPNIDSADKYYAIDLYATLPEWLDEENLIINHRQVFNISQWKITGEHTAKPAGLKNIRTFWGRESGFNGKEYNGLWIESKNDAPSFDTRKLVFSDHNFRASIVTFSKSGASVAYFFDDTLHIRSLGVSSNKNEKYYYIDVSQMSGDFWSWQKELIQSRLKENGFIRAVVSEARRHPITGEAIEASDIRKSFLQLIKYDAEKLIFRFSRPIKPGSLPLEGDYVTEISSNLWQGHNIGMKLSAVLREYK